MGIETRRQWKVMPPWKEAEMARRLTIWNGLYHYVHDN